MPKDVEGFIVGDDNDGSHRSSDSEESALTASSSDVTADEEMEEEETAEEVRGSKIKTVDEAISRLHSFIPPTIASAGELPLPQGLSPSLKLHDYQVTGFNWLHKLATNKIGGILGRLP